MEGRLGASIIPRIVVPLVLGAFLAVASPALAAVGDDPPPVDVGHVLTKAVTFESLSSTGETALFLAFYGGSGATGLTIFAISLTSSAAVYVGHELAWGWLVPGSTDSDDPEVLATKAASYRVASTLRSFAIGNVMGVAEVARSAAFAASVAVADTALYVANDLAFAWWGHHRTAAGGVR